MTKSDGSNGRIEVNEDVMMGKSVIKNTRIPVEQVLRKLTQDISGEKLLDEYPNLSREDGRSPEIRCGLHSRGG